MHDTPRIEYELNPSLPGLAWLATVAAPSGSVRVIHGAWVETQPRFFFEGAWAGAFERGRPDETEVAYGSGAVVTEDAICFVPCLATTDYIYYQRDADAVIASNSLALLLAATGDALDPRFLHYADVNNSILKGIHEYQRRIPTQRGAVSRLLHGNLRVTASDVTEVPKPASPPFPTFAAYRDYLAASYAALAGNARASERRWPMRIYSTQSRGYDSTAINTIAAPHGLDAVFTIRTAKGGGAFADHPEEPEVNDDGTDIAVRLGIERVIPLERRSYSQDFAGELYYHASMHECQDANLMQAADHLVAPALLLTGTYGDVLWYTTRAWYYGRPEYRGDSLSKADLGAHGLTEVRLRSGYVQVAMPFIGGRRRAEILTISESSEMTPWRLGTEYDRPIARRLGESAGVPRTDFGQVKVASVVEFTPPQVPQSAALREAYLSFLVREGLRRPWQLRLFPAVHRANATFWFARHDRYRLVHYALRAASKVLRRDVAPPTIWSDLRGSLHCFAVNVCAAEYRRSLGSAWRARA